MKKIIIAGLISLAFVSIVAAAPDIKEGLWEIHAKMEMTGMSVKLPAVTHQQCITKENLVPKNIQDKSKDCTVSNNNVNANTVSWTVNCVTRQGTMNGNGKVTYQGETFSGGFNMNMDGPHGAMTMSTKMNGRYIGACP